MPMMRPRKMNPQFDPAAELLAHIRRAQAEFGGRVEELRAEGFEIEEFLNLCGEMAAKLESGNVDWAEVRPMMKTFEAMADEMLATTRLHRQADAVKARTQLPMKLAEMDDMAANLRKHGGAMEVRSAEEIEASLARVRKGLEEGKVDQDELQNLQLTVGAQLAEVERRERFREAMRALFWELCPEERRAQFTAEQRANLDKVVEWWRREKEQVLGSLPLEDRRRLEAMRYEDFDKPGATDP